MKELVKPNELEKEAPELDFYCESRESCSWFASNGSLEEEDEILF